MSNVDRLDTFEIACKHFLGDFSNFKNLISTQIKSLDGLEWSFDKGSTKVCSADEKGLKKRCKVGITYRLQVELSQVDTEIIWSEFSRFWGATTLNQVERVYSNEELGRYQFIANDSIGDEITCDIYLLNEWNIPQLNMLGYVSARYRKVDVEEV
ncbi:hypothetical protein [Veillonella sp.]|uniref:hypothetical protein n=1 Tax=Veillonella sp. TaxID=1926307 RepID=UPI00290691BA|nr:hypothetical protein [Veillonella sp.]MDU3433295.1 hypothetical protein [Veillonella sp.]